MNALIVTSCYRIKQTLLATRLNAAQIAGDFALILVDCSSPDQTLESEHAEWQKDPQQRTEPTAHNYCNEVARLEHVRSFARGPVRIIHLSPWLPKQRGDAEMTTMGLVAATLLDCPYAVKISGVAVMRRDLLRETEEHLDGEGDLLMATRSHFPQLSTRVIGFNVSRVLRHGPMLDALWVQSRRHYYTEERLRHLLHGVYHGRIKMQPWCCTDGDLLLDGGGDPSAAMYRPALQPLAEKIPDDPYVTEFLQGGIWW